MSDQAFLICIRVKRGEAPPAPSCEDKCGICGEPVWRAFSSPRDLPIFCLECFIEAWRNNPAQEVKVMPPTPAQLDNLEALLKKKN